LDLLEKERSSRTMEASLMPHPTRAKMAATQARPAGADQPSEVDVNLAAQLRRRRAALGMTQAQLADALGVTSQQVQKYERGANRVAASRLFDLSRILDIPIDFFFEGLSKDRVAPSRRDRHAFKDDLTPPVDEATMRRETLELVGTFYKIRDPRLRMKLFELIKSKAPPER
jgi:transcriptional regulator with XRE-family HTH domain